MDVRAQARTPSMTREHSWLPQIGAAWRVGIDGISLLLILLTLLMLPLVLLFSWRFVGQHPSEVYERVIQHILACNHTSVEGQRRGCGCGKGQGARDIH